MKKILLIDDENIVHMSLGLNLIALRHKLFSITDPIKAIEYAKYHEGMEEPDLIFVDLMMGDILGTDVIKIMRRSRYFDSIPIILYTGYDYIKDYGRVIKSLNIAEVLIKPSTKEMLIQCLNRNFKIN